MGGFNISLDFIVQSTGLYYVPDLSKKWDIAVTKFTNKMQYLKVRYVKQ